MVTSILEPNEEHTSIEVAVIFRCGKMAPTRLICFMALLMLAFCEDANHRPENEVLELGQEFVWQCKMSTNQFPGGNNILWTNERQGDNSIYVGRSVLQTLRDQFEVFEEDTAEYKRRDLKFKNVSLDEGDLYYCINGVISGRGYSANVIVADPNKTKCDIFPLRFYGQLSVAVKEGESIKITCHVTYTAHRGCRAEGLWQGSRGDSLKGETQYEGRAFTAILNVDEDFKNASSYSFSVKFKCQKPQGKAEFSTKEPIFETKYATPVYYLKENSLSPETTPTSTSTSLPFSLHSGASELNPTVARGSESQPMTMTYVFAGILAFFAILVIILVTLFLVKHRRRSSDDTLTMYTRGQSMMTENVAYRRQPVSCENSYNMQANINLTPPPQTSMAFQGVLSPHVPPSAAPLLPQGLQPFHHGAPLQREVSAEDSEVYDKIDDKGVVPSIYLDSIKKPSFSQSSSSHAPSFTSSSVGYVPMTPSRMPSGHRAPSIPSSPPIFNPDPGVYLVPQDKKEVQ